jgi:hypothetical protein
MNAEIHDAFIYAVLADACYVGGLKGDDLSTKLGPRLTPTLATYIGENFRVVDQWTDPGNSGFSVTVFEDKMSLQSYVSFRGTEEWSSRDYITDADAYIGSGLARRQVIAMVNWYLRATTPTSQETVQIQATRSVDPTGELGPATYTTPGEGTLLGAAELNVEGHSLGGHLTTVFTRLFAGDVSNSHTYNGLGVGWLYPESILSEVESALGLGTTTWPDAAKQTNYYAEHGINSATNDWWLSQKGRRVPLFNEEGTTVPNHLMYKLTDSLALCDVLGMIDESLSLSDATKILDAASSEPAASLETLLDSLRKLYWKADDKTPVGDAGDSATTRVAYHENLDFLRRMLRDGALPGGEIISLVGQAPAALGAQAAEEDEAGLAVRYALMALNPFAIVGADYSLHNENGELDLHDEETDEGALTENWLKDRAAMLSAKIAVNTTDNNGASPAYFKDVATNTVLGGNLFGAARRTVFGGEAGDTIEGGFNEDRHYGGAGADTINGGWSADYIEGNAGDDTLNGDSGDDEIRGGAGKDTLDGGSDADKLYGGSGEDTLKGGAGDDRLEGNADRDELAGGRAADILLGGEGDDTLYGDDAVDDDRSGGDDRLEGGEGADRLYGGGGKDVLQGGAGDDKLRGGASAADYMVGGAGSDTYIYKSEDQADLIYDEDGQGHIEYDGATLSGGRGRGKNSRVFFDNPDNPDYTYSVSGDMDAGPVTLTIKRNKDSRGQLTVFDFYDGDLGIHLKDGDEDKAPRYKRPPPPPQDPGRQNRGDPLVIDLAGTGLSTYGLERNLHFDHDQDRFAEKTGWIAAGSGVLVLDANPSTGSGQAGVLDNGQELFGDFTRLPGGQLAANGFAALSQYDRNRDGRIDAGDPIWSSLKVAVWETDPRGETVLGDPAAAMSLKTLEELGIASIGLDSSIATVTDENGNTRTRSGTVTLADGTTRELAEYRFARDTAETTFLDWRDLPEEIAVLPELTLGGIRRNCLNYGEVPTCTC